MARIPESTINQIKDRLDIVELIGSYVSYTKTSGQNNFALCPFHDEKSASFSVSKTKQIYHCFGCHKGGDAISFIMDIEHLSYPEAIKFLGDKLGIEVLLTNEDNDKYKEEKKRKERLYELNADAARFFYKSLNATVGEHARKYLNDRGIKSTSSIKFGLGYASSEWQDLYNFIVSKNYSNDEITNSGLFRKNKNGGWYDLYRNRLMFPIIDVMGNIIAFGGRVLDDSNPKYINSPENLIYSKGYHMYGLNLAKRSKRDKLIIVEGYMDCIALHQAGFDNAIASLGTALTSSQAALVRKYTQEVVLAYDMDDAGRTATRRNIEVLEDKNVKTNVLILENAKDPDEFLSTHSAEEFERALENAPSALDYKFLEAKRLATNNDRLDRIEYQELASDVILEIKNPIVRELYISKLSENLSVSIDSIKQVVEQKENTNQRANRREYKKRATRKEFSEDNKQVEKQEDRFIHLNKLEISFLVKLIKYPDIYSQLKKKASSKWIANRFLSDFVSDLLIMAEQAELDEAKFFTLVNTQEEDIRAYINRTFSESIINEDSRDNRSSVEDSFKYDIYSLELNFYDRLSNYYSKKLDTDLDKEEENNIRQQFINVRMKKRDLERSFKQ